MQSGRFLYIFHNLLHTNKIYYNLVRISSLLFSNCMEFFSAYPNIYIYIFSAQKSYFSCISSLQFTSMRISFVPFSCPGCNERASSLSEQHSLMLCRAFISRKLQSYSKFIALRRESPPRRPIES